MMELGTRYDFGRFLKNKFVILGLTVRLVLAPFFMHNYDFNLFVSAARAYYSSWTLTYFTNWAYPLFFYLLLLAFYFPADLISDGFYLFGQSVSISEKFFVKLPFIVSDLFIAYMLYRILMENGKGRYALFVALFYLLNPLSIFTSSVYGTFDSVSILFALLGFYHFLHGRYGLSGLELGVGFGIKFQPAILVPVFLLFMWREAKGGIPRFLLCFGVPAVLSFIPPAVVYYEPITHYWTFRLSVSNLATSYARAPVQLVDPNMTYRALLLRCGFFEILSYTTLIEVTVFAGLFLLFVFLVWRKKMFDHYFRSRLEYLTACVVAVYMIFYLSYGRINQYYALWALPFLLILFHFGDLNRVLLLTFNFIPLVQNFSRDSIFYYLNGNYTSIGVGWVAGKAAPYGASWAMGVAAGFLFSLSCVFVFVSLFGDVINNHQSFRKLYQFFNRISETKKNTLLSLLIMCVFLLIVSSINTNGLYWSGYPITFYIPVEWVVIPRPVRYLMDYVLLFDLLPLSLFLSLSLPKNFPESGKSSWKYLKLSAFLVSISTLTLLGCVILGATLPYVAAGTGFFFGCVPVFGALRILCEHGGIITSLLILTSSAIALDLLSKPWVCDTDPLNFKRSAGQLPSSRDDSVLKN